MIFLCNHETDKAYPTILHRNLLDSGSETDIDSDVDIVNTKQSLRYDFCRYML